MLANRPDEPDEFTSDRRDGSLRVFASGKKSSISRMQALLGFPGDPADVGGDHCIALARISRLIPGGNRQLQAASTGTQRA